MKDVRIGEHAVKISNLDSVSTYITLILINLNDCINEYLQFKKDSVI